MTIEQQPAYKLEDFGDTEIKTEEELDEAKIEAGVKSHEKALRDAMDYAYKTNDRILIENIWEKTKELGLIETISEPKIEKQDKKMETVDDVKLTEEINEIVDNNPDIKDPSWAKNRIAKFVKKDGLSLDEAEKRTVAEDKIAKISPAYINTLGMIDIIKSRQDLVKKLIEKNIKK